MQSRILLLSTGYTGWKEETRRKRCYGMTPPILHRRSAWLYSLCIELMTRDNNLGPNNLPLWRNNNSSRCHSYSAFSFHDSFPSGHFLWVTRVNTPAVWCSGPLSLILHLPALHGLVLRSNFGTPWINHVQHVVVIFHWPFASSPIDHIITSVLEDVSTGPGYY